LIRQTCNEFIEDECPRLAASLAFCTVISLPPLILLIVATASLFVSRELVTGRLERYFNDVMGERGAQMMLTILERTPQGGSTLWATVLSTLMLLVGASGVMSELQSALNRAWGVKPDEREGWHMFLWKRVLSLGMVLAIAFLLLVSLVASWFLAETSALVGHWAPRWLSAWMLWLLDGGISIALITLVFAAMMRFLPDVRLKWSDVWVGALVTALLFVAGKFGISAYLAWNDVTSAYGAAGSLALVLIWLYYSAMIFFFGAELTQVRARRRGKHVQPEAGAALTARS
jgi:membrane protein